MPLLELDDGTFIAESVAMRRYAEELHSQPSLFGTTPIERAMIEMWNRRMEFELLRPMTDHFVNLSPFWEGRRAQVAQAGHVARAHAETRMRWLNDQLATRPFIAGDYRSGLFERAAVLEKAVGSAASICKNGPALAKPYEHHLVLDHIRRALARRDRGKVA